MYLLVGGITYWLTLVSNETISGLFKICPLPLCRCMFSMIIYMKPPA